MSSEDLKTVLTPPCGQENIDDSPSADSPKESSGSISPPQWLDSAFIESALRTKHSSLEVTICDVKPAVSAGENYACLVFRAKVQTVLHGPFSLIVKCMPEAEFRVKFITESEVTIREIRMYNETLPMLRGELSTPNFPLCYYTFADGTRDSLVFKDMCPEGYRTRSRKLGLDEPHCRLALKEIAHLHGLSIALRMNDPKSFQTNIVEKYKDKMFMASKKENMNQFLTMTITALADAARLNLPSRFHALADIMVNFIAKTGFDQTVDCVQLPESEEEQSKLVLALNHGDAWSSNLLFRYDKDEESDEDKPMECALIDFQVSRCAPPVLDLLYFFYTSTTKDTRDEHLNNLLHFYMKEVRIILREREISDPGSNFYASLSELKKDMQRVAIFGFISSCFVMPLVVADAADAPDLDTMTEENFTKAKESPFAKMYSGSLFCKRFRGILEDFDDMGFFKEQLKLNSE